MRVLLIYPPITGNIKSKIQFISEPLGIAYIAAVCEKAGYQVSILDAQAEGIFKPRKMSGNSFRFGLSDREIYHRIKFFNPDIVGIAAVYTAYEADALNTARIVRSFNKNIKIVGGGNHCALAYEKFLMTGLFDYVVLGEGEETFLELCEAVKNNQDCGNIQGLATVSDKKVKLHAPRPLIKDIDQLPFPARHLLPMDIYFRLQRKRISNYAFYAKDRICSILSSRGCPYGCSFCSVKNVWQNQYRVRSPGNVISEIESLVNNYKIKEFAFADDNVALQPGRFEDICKGLINSRLDLKWCTPNGISFWTLNKDLLKLMKQSGCYRVTFGVDAGNEKSIKKYLSKPVQLDKAREILEHTRKLGIWSHVSMIIGFPDETEADIEQSIDYISHLNSDSIVIFTAQPYIGTRLRDIFEDYGLLSDQAQPQSSLFRSKFNTLFLKSGQVIKYQKQGEREFALNRLKHIVFHKGIFDLFRKIRSVEDFLFLIRIIKFKILKGISA